MTRSSFTDQPTRFESLTALRFFAAIFVVAHHYVLLGYPKGPSWFLNFLHNGPHAVSFFFILSGFVLSYGHFRCRRDGTLRARDFWAARLARIFPIYALALCVAFPFFLYSYLKAENISALKFGMSLILVPTLLQAWLPLTALSWNTPAWSLSVEAFFYLIFPFIINRFAWKISSRSFILWLVGASALEGIRLHWLTQTNESSNLRHLISYFPLLHLPKFLLGIILAKYYVEMQRSEVLLRHAGKLTWLAVAMVLVLLTIPASFPQSLIGALLISAFSILTFCASCIREKGAIYLNTQSAVSLGEASYGIYILHLPICMWYAVIMKFTGIVDWYKSPFFGSFYFLCVVAASIGLYSIIEVPMRNWLRIKLVG